MKDKKVTIIGLGLIGGSLAKALHERLGMRKIAAVNRSERSLQQALAEGTICEGLTEITDAVYESDLIFICTPVKRAMEYIDILADKVKPGCIITDVGSTKGEIVNYVNSMNNPPCFIGGHPMAGTEKTGYASGFSHLFENAYYILTPGKCCDLPTADFMTELVKGIGAIPVVLEAEEHDRITAGISHVPHVIASALVNLVKEMDSSEGKMQILAAGGFKDITRIASSSPEMWENIVLSNRNQVIDVLDRYIEVIKQFKRAADSGDSHQIYHFFESAKNYRDLFPSTRKGLINPVYDILVDVIDKPGIIGEIATLLGQNGINIKNINVSNNREFEQGCLRITLSDGQSMNNSYDLLAREGYKVYKIG